ncbi:unnamed protein product [Bathycoccus prasinos]
MGRPSLDTGGEIAVIDLVAHLYSTKGLRRDLCAIWDRYSAATTEERKQKGFEIVRNYHSQLTRMFRDDPDGECLDIDDLRSVWEEFVDALRDATGASEAYSDNEKYTSNTYQSLEKPVMKRNESFHKLAQDLNELVLQKSPGSSRGGSTHGIQRISSKGMLLGIGCSSREPSLRGGNEWAKMKSEMSPEALAKKLERTAGDK